MHYQSVIRAGPASDVLKTAVEKNLADKKLYPAANIALHQENCATIANYGNH